MHNALSAHKIFPSFWQAALLILISLTALFGLGITFGGLGFIAEKLQNGFLTAVSVFFQHISNLILIPIALSILCYNKTPLKEIFSFKNTRAIYLLPLIVLILGSSVIESEMDNITRFILPMPEFVKSIMKELVQDKWTSFALLVIIASLTEELLCRGVILRGFLTHYGKWRAIILSALLFSLFHVNPYQLFSAFIAGMVLGWVYAETRSLYLCFFIHSLHNLLVWIFAFKFINLGITGYDKDIDLSANVFQPLWFDLTGILLFCLGGFLLKKLFPPDAGPEPENEQTETLNAYQ